MIQELGSLMQNQLNIPYNDEIMDLFSGDVFEIANKLNDIIINYSLTQNEIKMKGSVPNMGEFIRVNHSETGEITGFDIRQEMIPLIFMRNK